MSRNLFAFAVLAVCGSVASAQMVRLPIARPPSSEKLKDGESKTVTTSREGPNGSSSTTTTVSRSGNQVTRESSTVHADGTTSSNSSTFTKEGDSITRESSGVTREGRVYSNETKTSRDANGVQRSESWTKPNGESGSSDMTYTHDGKAVLGTGTVTTADGRVIDLSTLLTRDGNGVTRQRVANGPSDRSRESDIARPGSGVSPSAYRRPASTQGAVKIPPGPPPDGFFAPNKEKPGSQPVAKPAEPRKSGGTQRQPARANSRKN